MSSSGLDQAGFFDGGFEGQVLREVLEPQDGPVEFEAVRQIPQPEGATLVADFWVDAGISHLLDVGSPMHVAWGIISIVVYSVDAVIWRRSRPNVSGKLPERDFPSRVQRDPPHTISFERRVILVKAACFDAHPGAI